MDKEGLTLEQIKEIYAGKINDTYTLNLAVSMLENYDELFKKYEEKDKEIERLHNEIKTLLKENGNKEKVIIKQNNIIDELKWKPVSQYDNGNHDWVLIKMFIKEDNYECVPIVAEKRMGVWKNQDGETLDEDMFEIKYFMDMQQLDKLEKLKEGK